MAVIISQSPKWHLQIICSVPPTVQNQKIFTLISYMTKKNRILGKIHIREAETSYRTIDSHLYLILVTTLGGIALATFIRHPTK